MNIPEVFSKLDRRSRLIAAAGALLLVVLLASILFNGGGGDDQVDLEVAGSDDGARPSGDGKGSGSGGDEGSDDGKDDKDDNGDSSDGKDSTDSTSDDGGGKDPDDPDSDDDSTDPDDNDPGDDDPTSTSSGPGWPTSTTRPGQTTSTSVKPPSSSTTSTTIKPTTTLSTTTTAPPRVPTAPVPRVAIYGDSGALGLGYHSGTYTSSPDRLLEKVGGQTPLACGVVMTHDWCVPPSKWGDVAAANKTQIAVVYSGSWEVRCLKPVDQTWTECRSIGDPVFDAYLRSQLTARTNALFAAGVTRVVLVKQEYGPGASADLLSHGDLWARWYQILDEYAAADSRIKVVDIRPWFKAQPNQQEIRYDGYHYTELSWVVWRDFLEEELYWKIWQPLMG